jgi:TolB-like protein/Flp pilus assembly protein TadD
VAVLPFANLSADHADEYFSDGMTDELTEALAHVAGLRVAARTSSFAFKSRGTDVRTIGRTLGVATVLEGSVRRAGPRLRVTAELVNTGDGYQIWSQTYEREMRDVFAVQDDIARAIVAALSVQLGRGDTRAGRTTGGATGSTGAGASAAGASVPSGAPGAAGTADWDAYDLYLKGRYFWNTRRNAAELEQAAGFFHQALARDPHYARAEAGLADCYSLLTMFGGRRPIEAYPRARAAAERALALDSTIAEAHTSLGIVHLFYDWDFAGAERELSRAIALDSASATARLFHAWSLLVTAHVDDAITEMQQARRLDPLNLLINARLGTILYYTGRNEAGRAVLVRALQLDSTYGPTRASLAFLEADAGRLAEAERLPPPPPALAATIDGAVLGVVYAKAGRPADARRVISTLEAWSAHEFVAPEIIAGIFATLGERDSAFVWLERARASRSSTLVFLTSHPMFTSLYTDPRFAILRRKMGLPEIPSPAVSAGHDGR